MENYPSIDFKVWLYDGAKIPQREDLSQITEEIVKFYTLIEESK